MQTARQAARQRRRRRRLTTGAAVAVTAAGLLVCLVTAMRPGSHDPDGATGSGPALGANAAAPAVSGGQATPSASPSSPESSPAGSSPGPSPTTAGPATPAAPGPSAKAATPKSGPGAAPSAGRIRPGTTYPGVATAYAAGDGNGACLFGPSDDLMIAAMNTADYESSKACGAYVRVRAASGASITVRITNECPLPCAPGQLDLSEQAFAKLADPKVGRIPITWSLLSPAVSDPISLRYKTGSSRYWCAIQVIGHRNPVARLEVRTATGWRSLPRTGYNHFLSADGTGCGGVLRVTDIHGEELTIEGIALSPDVVQRTRFQFAPH
ncbi:expansin EXLX1 family cellulose-binding protein [Streptomyces sp. NPDC091268]|uniref:expansin EXLX1 family cellulose-binding protein n=1 Tax=Streptomyces sp. NPDC091268 TaxID=3365979 RepID=UPI00380CB0FD